MFVERVFPQKSMPNQIELRVDEKTGEKQLVFLYVRNISRNLDPFKTDLAHALQDAGLVVKISALGNEITLEQFERTGVYQFKQSTTVQSKQGLYNKRSELKLLEDNLRNISEDDPRHYLVAQRVQHLRAMLSTVEPLASQEAVKDSDKRLRLLEELLKQPEPQPQGDKDVTSKPATTSQTDATDTNGEGLPTTPASPDRREGD